MNRDGRIGRVTRSSCGGPPSHRPTRERPLGEHALGYPGIFDAFPDESGRQAHLSGPVAAALKSRSGELFASPPAIDRADVLAAKLL